MTFNSRLKATIGAAIFSLSLLGGATLAPGTALAGNDDDEIICFEFTGANGSDELECDTRGAYKAECALTDPENTSEFCKDINSAFETPFGGLVTTQPLAQPDTDKRTPTRN